MHQHPVAGPRSEEIAASAALGGWLACSGGTAMADSFVKVAGGPATGGMPVAVWVDGGWFTGGCGPVRGAAPHGEVTIRHVSLGAAAGGQATSGAVITTGAGGDRLRRC